MLETIIKGDINSISAKLELKLDEYFINLDEFELPKLLNKFQLPVWIVCRHVFKEDSIPESKAYLIYNTTKVYKHLFIKFGSILDEYELATNTTRKIILNKSSLALLMLLYNQQFRDFCNITEKRTEILRYTKLELSKYIQL